MLCNVLSYWHFGFLTFVRYFFGVGVGVDCLFVCMFVCFFFSLTHVLRNIQYNMYIKVFCRKTEGVFAFVWFTFLYYYSFFLLFLFFRCNIWQKMRGWMYLKGMIKRSQFYIRWLSQNNVDRIHNLKSVHCNFTRLLCFIQWPYLRSADSKLALYYLSNVSHNAFLSNFVNFIYIFFKSRIGFVLRSLQNLIRHL